MMPGPDLRAIGKHLGREHYQRGHLTKVGKRTKHWKAHWYSYDAENKRHHHSRTLGLCTSMTRSEAQWELDRIIQAATSETPMPSAQVSLGKFFEDVYLPVRGHDWALNTRRAMTRTIERHILPRLGATALGDLNKVQIEKHLIALADRGLSRVVVDWVRMLIKSALEEAVENDFIHKNPAGRIKTPQCKPRQETRSLTEAEVQRIFGRLSGRERLMFRVLIECGPRPGELFALRKDDLLPGSIRFDESALDGKAGPTKTRRTRIVPLPTSLELELRQWAECCSGDLLFPNRAGCMMHRASTGRQVLLLARKLSGIPDLTYRACRATCATWYGGDLRDLQEVLGHAHPEMTLERYKKPVPERMRMAVEELDARLMPAQERIN